MYPQQESISDEKKSLSTLPNIQYIVQGLDVFLQNNLEGIIGLKELNCAMDYYRTLPVFQRL